MYRRRILRRGGGRRRSSSRGAYAGTTGHGAFPRVVYSGGAEDIRKGCRAAAFVLVRRVGEDFSRRRKAGPEVRHGVLGRGREPVASALESTGCTNHQAGFGGTEEGRQDERRDHYPRARLHPRPEGVLF